MKNPFLLGLLALFLVPPSIAYSQSDDAVEPRFKRTDSGFSIKSTANAPVHATADGVVEFAGELEGYGSSIRLDHGSGIQTIYSNLAKITVFTNAAVNKGQVIGFVRVPTNGASPELIYEIRIAGKAVNPLPFMGKDDATIKRQNGTAVKKTAEAGIAVNQFIFYKGYKVWTMREAFSPAYSCLDLIIRRYNISYLDKYGDCLDCKKLIDIRIRSNNISVKRNSGNFKYQKYGIHYWKSVNFGRNLKIKKYLEIDDISCESKNGVAIDIIKS